MFTTVLIGRQDTTAWRRPQPKGLEIRAVIGKGAAAGAVVVLILHLDRGRGLGANGAARGGNTAASLAGEGGGQGNDR